MQKCNVALVNRFSGRRKTNMADGKDREDETSFLLLEVGYHDNITLLCIN